VCPGFNAIPGAAWNPGPPIRDAEPRDGGVPVACSTARDDARAGDLDRYRPRWTGRARRSPWHIAFVETRARTSLSLRVDPEGIRRPPAGRSAEVAAPHSAAPDPRRDLEPHPSARRRPRLPPGALGDHVRATARRPRGRRAGRSASLLRVGLRRPRDR